MLNSKQALEAIHNLYGSIQMKFENSTYTAFFKYIKAHLSETWMIFIDLNDLLVLAVVPRTNQQKYFFWWVIFSFLKEKKILVVVLNCHDNFSIDLKSHFDGVIYTVLNSST
jgi:hypothetical protein